VTLEAAVDAARGELTWFAACQSVWPPLDCFERDWRQTIPVELVPVCLTVELQHYRELSFRLRGEVDRLERVVRDAHSAAQALVDALPAQGTLL
jgi:hypothetical protein